MPTVRLHLEYDGTEFHGWQVQPGVRTVQGELAAALAELAREPVLPVGAGRTDAGVHALGQVASAVLEHEIEPRRLLHALAALLPGDVRVWACGIATDGFSARSDATARRYVYRLLRRPSALGARTHYVLRAQVDAERMAAAAALLVGEHDFSAFAAARTASPERICRVESARIDADAVGVRFEIVANRFLHNMVRRITGCLVEIGRGQLAPESIATILETRDATRGGPCLPPQGLFFVDARYPEDPRYAATAVVDAPRWSP